MHQNHKDLLEEDQSFSKLKQISNLPQFYCTNGKDPSLMKNKEILIEFSQGPCSPLMLVPGIMATRMAV